MSENILPTTSGSEQTVLPDTTTTVESYDTLVQQVTYTNVKLDTLTNIGIVLIIGVGILVGALATKAFFEYLWG